VTGTPRGAEPDRRWLILLAAVVASRVIVLAAAALAEGSLHITTADATSASGAHLRVSDVPLLASLSSWDGFYYLDIAQRGYAVGPVNGPYPNTVFFPLYPVLIRVVHDLTGIDWVVAAVVLSNVALAASVAVFARLGAAVVGPRGLLAAVLLCFAPGGTAFSMVYADSLFLLASIGSFLAVERGSVRWAGVLYAIATLSRPVGILLGLPLLILALRRRGRRIDLLALAGGPAALLAFAAYQGLAVGDPLAFVNGQAAWSAGHEVTAPPGGTPAASGGGFGSFVGPTLIAVFLAYGVAAIAPLRRRAMLAYGAHGALGFVSTLALGRLVSSDRYVAALFPAYWTVAGAHVAVRLLWGIGSCAALFLLSYFIFRLSLPP
jgi:hypothetical protein